jgi:hypothetical protein
MLALWLHKISKPKLNNKKKTFCANWHVKRHFFFNCPHTVFHSTIKIGYINTKLEFILKYPKIGEVKIKCLYLIQLEKYLSIKDVNNAYFCFRKHNRSFHSVCQATRNIDKQVCTRKTLDYSRCVSNNR